MALNVKKAGSYAAQIYAEDKRYVGHFQQMGKEAYDATFNAVSEAQIVEAIRGMQAALGNGYPSTNSGFEVVQADTIAGGGFSNVNNFGLAVDYTGPTSSTASQEEKAGRMFVGGRMAMHYVGRQFNESVISPSSPSHFPIVDSVLTGVLGAVNGTIEDLSANYYWDGASPATGELNGRTVTVNVSGSAVTANIVGNNATRVFTDTNLSGAAGNHYRINLIAPTGSPGTRTDTVLLDVYMDEVNSTEDTTLLANLGGGSIETARVMKMRQEVFVRQDIPTVPYNTFETYIDGNSVIHYRIQIAQLFRTTSTSITTAMILDKRQRLFNLEEISKGIEYVTVGDGTNSFGKYNGTDWSPIQQAINDVKASPLGVGTVLIRRGNYSFDTVNTAGGGLLGLDINPGIRLLGEGWNTVLQMDSTAPDGQCMFNATGSTNAVPVTFENLRVLVYAPTGQTTGWRIIRNDMTGATTLKITDCNFETQKGVTCVLSTTSGTEIIADGLLITGDVFTGTPYSTGFDWTAAGGSGITTVASTRCSSMARFIHAERLNLARITRCDLSMSGDGTRAIIDLGNSGAGFTTGANFVVIDDCILSATAGSFVGIRCYNPDSLVISNTIFRTASGAAMVAAIDLPRNSNVTTGSVSYYMPCSIIGNTFEAATSTATSYAIRVGTASLALAEAAMLSITGNSLVGCGIKGYVETIGAVTGNTMVDTFSAASGPIMVACHQILTLSSNHIRGFGTVVSLGTAGTMSKSHVVGNEIVGLSSSSDAILIQTPTQSAVVNNYILAGTVSGSVVRLNGGVDASSTNLSVVGNAFDGIYLLRDTNTNVGDKYVNIASNHCLAPQTFDHGNIILYGTGSITGNHLFGGAYIGTAVANVKHGIHVADNRFTYTSATGAPSAGGNNALIEVTTKFPLLVGNYMQLGSNGSATSTPPVQNFVRFNTSNARGQVSGNRFFYVTGDALTALFFVTNPNNFDIFLNTVLQVANTSAPSLTNTAFNIVDEDIAIINKNGLASFPEARMASFNGSEYNVPAP